MRSSACEALHCSFASTDVATAAFSLFGAPLAIMALQVFAGVALLAQAASAQSLTDVCDGEQARPVLAIHGFQGGPLYNSSNGYSVEYLNLTEAGTGSQSPASLRLPTQWNGLSQEMTAVGPEDSRNDPHPSLDGPTGELFLNTVSSFLLFSPSLCHACALHLG